MYAIIQSILSVVISIVMQTAVIGSVQVDPATEVDTFMEGIEAGTSTVVNKYMDNDYVNMLENSGDKDASKDMHKYIFKNFKYEIVDTGTRGNVAVAKVKVTNCDFSKVIKSYDKESYKYVTDHLYDNTITNKSKLSKKCLDIYVKQIQKVADKGKTSEHTIYLPLESNNHYGWEVLVSDSIMKTLLGNIEIPNNK